MKAPSFLPEAGKRFYTDVYNKSYSNTNDEFLAERVAWSLTKARMTPVGNGLVANSIDFEPVQLFRFELEQPSDVIISNSENGDIELDISLAHTGVNKVGQWFAEEDLQHMAEQINREGSTFPDVNHEILSRLRHEFADNPVLIANAIKKEKGVFKTVKALVHEGKLWIKAVLDKRYKNYAENFRKVSIEAIGKLDTATGRVMQPLYLGFSFTRTPQLDGVGVSD